MHEYACFVANSIMCVLLTQKLCLTGREELWRSGPGCEKAKNKFRTNFEIVCISLQHFPLQDNSMGKAYIAEPPIEKRFQNNQVTQDRKAPENIVWQSLVCACIAQFALWEHLC